MDYYILVDKIPVKVAIKTWAEWMKKRENVIVKKTMIEGNEVSTVFLGLDHNFFRDEGSEPLLFETMIFGQIEDETEYQIRCSTWEEAEKQHEEAIRWVNEKINR